jgi:hypothetical protein
MHALSLSSVHLLFKIAVAFQGERILFRALPKSHLEVCTVLAEGTNLSTIDCKSLQVNKPVLQDRLAELFK